MKTLLAILLSLTINGQSVDSLLAQMTTKEKATLCVGNGWSSMFMGIGMQKASTRHHAVPGAAGETRAIKRLGIPSIVLSDGPAGVRICATTHLFPSGVSLKNIEDTTLIEEVGYAIGCDAREHGVHVMLAPGMNLTTNPLCGRNYEYYSDDPEISARIARAYIRGVQRAGVGTTAKHYAMNNVEHNRMKYNFLVDSTTERDLYLRNFELTVHPDSNSPWAIMSSYNKVNGEYVQLSPYLLDTVLRQQFGYEGVVMTDWMFYDHICDRINAGNDLIMPGMSEYIGRITRGVKSGKVTEERLNEAAKRVLILIAKSLQTPDTLQSNPNYTALIRRAGAKGCKVIKNVNDTENDGSTNPPTTSKPLIALYGTSAYHTLAGGTGSGFVRSDSIINIAEGLEHNGYKVLDDHKTIHKKWLKLKRNFEKVGGMSLVSRFMGRPAAKFLIVDDKTIREDATEADIAILVIGRMTGEGKDISNGSMTLSNKEKHSLQVISGAFHQQGKRVVVLLNTPPYFETESWQHLADWIAEIGYPGEQAGNSVTDFLQETGIL